MIRIGDIVQPRGSQRRFFVEEHDIMRHEWILISDDERCQVVRMSDACARTVIPIGHKGAR